MRGNYLPILHLPRGVRSLTFFLNKSPELIEASSGNFLMRRSVWVPLPTPGAPTRIIRAARVRDMLKETLSMI
jgi:hypothetical protein